MKIKATSSWLYIVIGLAFSIGVFCLYFFKTTEINKEFPIDTNIFSSYGTLIGGVLGAFFSLIGIIMLIKTLDQQQANFNKQLFESKFFDLLKIHRENSNEINIKDRTGKKVFIALQKEFRNCKLIIDAINEMTGHKLQEKDRINIAYLSFFFGAIGDISTGILTEKLRRYNQYTTSILYEFKRSQRGFKRKFRLTYEPFQGHQSRLGHYFRHLYQTVKFVDKQPKHLLSYEDKYEYVKMLRAQLSTQEQAFLFYNSLSDLGKPWEKSSKLQVYQGLITKYNLIKNIPNGHTLGIDVKKYYPNIKYEGDSLTEERRRLIRLYQTSN